jgi:hypothetical protein
VVKEQLLNEDEAKKYLLELKEYRFIKMENIIQYACYLNGFSKEDINLPGTNVLNWRFVRRMVLTEQFL